MNAYSESQSSKRKEAATQSNERAIKIGAVTDLRPAAATHRQLSSMAHDSPRALQQQAMARIIGTPSSTGMPEQRQQNNIREGTQLQALQPACAVQAPVQRVLNIASAPGSPFRALTYKRYKYLRNKQRNLGLTAIAWQWLRRVALSPLSVSFSNWREAIESYEQYKVLAPQLSKAQSIKGGEMRYGNSPVEDLSMNDAHGIVQIADWIQAQYPIAGSTYVSPGGSADFFGTAMRIRGGVVVDIPLSDIKQERLQGAQRARVITFIQRCFAGKQLRANVVIFDAISTGSALLLLKELISEAMGVHADSIHLLGLNNPPGADGQEAVRSGQVRIVGATGGDARHASYVKSRLKNQSYKTFGRKYPKNPTGNLTDHSANQLVPEVPGMNAKLMTTLFAMHEIAGRPFEVAAESDEEEDDGDDNKSGDEKNEGKNEED